MRRRDFVRSLAAAGMATACRPPEWLRAGSSPVRQEARLAEGWWFARGDPAGAAVARGAAPGWEQAVVPHTARVEALVTGPVGSETGQWQGACWYRRDLQLDAAAVDRVVHLRFEAAMNVADVFLDGAWIGGHRGGFLPFVIDLTDRLEPGRAHLLAVRLDNRDDPITGPKPLAQLDFNLYHGIYRPVVLSTRDRLHITDALLADRTAGGGVFVSYPSATAKAATVRVQTHVRNRHTAGRAFRVRATLLEPNGTLAGRATTAETWLDAGADTHLTQELETPSPRLWSPAAPELYRLRVEVLDGDAVVDDEMLRIGIRRFDVARDGFTINGERMFLRGTNRHQEHPYIGFALSDAAQYRDARRIKEAGFDYVRLSHYPHAPAFMAACDELGLVVMDCIPGWQYFKDDPAFIDLQYRNCRDMIRRDRNHPCVILWEVSLNESGMTPEFVARTHAIAHEEYPGDQCFTAGWLHGYDVYLQARQHGGCRRETADPCLVSEYGDWEYYAMNAGLAQDAWADLSPAESNSRQLRWQGERALLQQALNFQEAHDDNHGVPAFGDGLWVMFDYNRGYAPDVESSGVMDLFRLPKFSYWFYRSQRDADERVADGEAGPLLFVASHWLPDSATDVRVFTNCDQVELRLNGRSIDRKAPDPGPLSARLKHPPITFRVGAFEPGTLEAIGWIGHREVARHVVRTPGPAATLNVRFDESGRPVDAVHHDRLFCHAELRDAAGTLVPDAWHNVAFGCTGPAQLIGHEPASSEAGIASILLDTAPSRAPVAVYSLSIVPAQGGIRILSGAATLRGRAEPFDVRWTSDGRDPGPAAAPYTGPVRSADGLRAGLLVRNRLVASLDAAAPRYRIPANAPLERREAFHR